MEILSSLASFEGVAGLYGLSFLCVIFATFVSVRSLTRDVFLHHKVVILCVGIAICSTNAILGARIAHQLTRVPHVQSVNPPEHGTLSASRPEIMVSFDTPVRFSSFRAYSYPDNELEIIPQEYSPGRIPFGRSVLIKPRSNFPPGEPVTIYLANIEGPLTHGYGGELAIPYVSEQLPAVIAMNAPTDLANVPIRQQFIFTTDKSSQDFSSWQAIMEPAASADVAVKGNTIIVEPAGALEQGATYSMKLLQIPRTVRYGEENSGFSLEPRLEKTVTFSVVKPPYVQAILPKGKTVNPADPISLKFEEPMDRISVEKGFTLSPKTNARLSWNTDSTVLRIDHDGLEKDTEFTLAVAAGIHTQAGGVSESRITHSFRTAGPVTLLSTTPAQGTDAASPSSRITFEFNQPIRSGSADSLLDISPPVKGTYAYAENTFTFTPEKTLAPNTTYTATMKPGIASVFGLPSKEPVSLTFKTKPDQTVLNIPFYKQQSDFTCNIASARMLLGFKGIQVSESDLISKIGNGGKRGSGNPYKGYVDDYGTYWDAISKGISAYRTNRIIKNGTLEDVTAELRKGNPIMTWGQNGWSDPHDISWTAADGTYIRAVNGMHSAVIRGFIGPQSNPTHILLNDPWRGQYTITTAEFLRRWGYFNVALVLE